MVRVVLKRGIHMEREALGHDGRVARALRLDGPHALQPDVAVALPRHRLVAEHDEAAREDLLLKRPRALVPRRALHLAHVPLHGARHGARPAHVRRRVRLPAGAARAVHRRRDVRDARQAKVRGAVGDDDGRVGVGVDAAHLREVLLLVRVVVLHDAQRVDPEVALAEAVDKLDGVGDGVRQVLKPEGGRLCRGVQPGRCRKRRRRSGWREGTVLLQRLDVAEERLEGGMRAPDVAQREVALARSDGDEAAPLDVDEPLGVVRKDLFALVREGAVHGVRRVTVIEPLPDVVELDPGAEAALRHELVAEVLELFLEEDRRSFDGVVRATSAVVTRSAVEHDESTSKSMVPGRQLTRRSSPFLHRFDLLEA